MREKKVFTPTHVTRKPFDGEDMCFGRFTVPKGTKCRVFEETELSKNDKVMHIGKRLMIPMNGSFAISKISEKLDLKKFFQELTPLN